MIAKRKRVRIASQGERLVSACENAGDQWAVAESLYFLGLRVDSDERRRMWHRSLQIKRELGDMQGIAEIMLDLALRPESELEEEYPLLLQALALFRSIGDPRGQIRCMWELAERSTTEPEDAVRLWRQVFEQFEVLGRERHGTWPEYDYNARSLALFTAANRCETAKRFAEAKDYFEQYLATRRSDTGIRNDLQHQHLIEEASQRIYQLTRHLP